MALTPSVSQKHSNKKKRSSTPKAKAAAAARAAASDVNINTMNINMNEQFLINRGGINGGAVLQIRTPNPNDVLSGRGGSVNAHPGNIQFREWVSHRRVDYNLAHSKNDKADICREIIAQVEALGGRFLGRDNPSSPFWIELDEERIMAKTSQALREGAPKIRLEHRDDEHTATSTVVSSSTKRRRSSNNTAARASSKPEAQAEPQQQQQRDDEPRAEQKRVRVDYNGHIVRPNQASPPLGAQPSPDQLLDNTEDPTDRESEILLPIMFPTRSGDEKVHRENSLACSDISGFSECFSDLAEPFVDPFENETSELLLFQHPHHHDALESRNSDPSLRLLSPRNLPSPPPPRLGVTRDTSSSNNHSYSSSNSDNGGLGALTQQQQQQSLNHSDSSSLYKFLADINNTNNNNHGVRPVFPLHHLHQPRPSLKRRSSSASNLSSRSSISSVLSDLPDAHRKAAPPADFVEGMTMIHDALHPWKDEFNNGGNNNTMSNHGRARSDKHHHSRLMSGSIAMRRRPTSSSSQ